MAREGGDALVRSRAFFAVALALPLVLPVLGGAAVEGVGGGVALVALALAGLLASGRRYVVLAARAVAVRASRPSDPRIRLNGSITDPPHHPVCPRAPGLA